MYSQGDYTFLSPLERGRRAQGLYPLQHICSGAGGAGTAAADCLTPCTSMFEPAAQDRPRLQLDGPAGGFPWLCSHLHFPDIFYPTASQANKQKLRLETKQRAARKAAENGEAIRPRWFSPLDTPMGEGIAYVSGWPVLCAVSREWQSILLRDEILPMCVTVCNRYHSISVCVTV